VRGPPGTQERRETLGVTGEHPFWVLNRAQPRFVPVRELGMGDVLALADGGTAEVIAKHMKLAEVGENFTTYNFEVAEFHTYFAGEAEVWVHNQGAACDRVKSIYQKMRDRGEAPWNAFKRTVARVSGAAEKKVPSQVFHKAAGECMEDILKTPGMRLPSYKEMATVNGGHFASWKSLGSMPEDAYKQMLGDFDVFDNLHQQWIRHKLEVHHGVPKAIMRKLGIPSSVWDDSPAFLTTMMEHRVGLESLHGRMAARGIDLRNLDAWNNNPDGLREALMDAYSDAGLPDLWNQCSVFIDSHLPAP
jgi:hypothetical protein